MARRSAFGAGTAVATALLAAYAGSALLECFINPYIGVRPQISRVQRWAEAETDLVVPMTEAPIFLTPIDVVTGECDVSSLPEEMGVYGVYDSSDRLQYIGLSRNIQKSVEAHGKAIGIQEVGDLITSVRCFEMPDGSKEDGDLGKGRMQGSLRGVAASLAAVAYGSHRTPREKVARPKARPKARQIPGPRNAKVLLNNLVSKTLRRSLLAGDVVYDVTLADDTWRANVRIYGLEEDQPLKFSGFGSTEKEAELRAAEAALAKLPPAPFVEPRYPKPQDAAAWVVEQLDAAEAVEVDSTMADVLPTIAHVAAQLEVEASFNLEEEPCRVVLMKKPLISWAPEEVRSILVSRKTEGGKLAAAMHGR
eukprot:symbB.v1.2.016559.t2/scaffold1261.1/size128201/4